MSDLMRYAAALEGAGDAKGPPPVERWDPPYCGELGLTIRRDGLWIYQGSPIGRAPLVRLFSTVLKREGERYFLVTPVEKLGVEVEDAPFLAVLMRAEGEGESRRLVFTTNVGDEVAAGPGHDLHFETNAETGEATPYVHVRRGLWALVARAVYYDLVALGETRKTAGREAFGVTSNGVFYPFAPSEDVFGGADVE